MTLHRNGLGIIPAYAGSTATTRGQIPSRADHPRIRGEHRKLGELRRHFLGSSPHTRGARRRPEQPAPERGIIPAYAGSTPTPALASRSCEDHPRIRGEHRGLGVEVPPAGGSSPHTRGALSTASFCGDRARIIPAYAGSTPRAPVTMVHGAGSSPHTRGAHLEVAVYPVKLGIIPAYAGSTVPVSVTPVSRWDHPRIRGEHG